MESKLKVPAPGNASLPSLRERQAHMSVAYENVADIVFVIGIDDDERFYFAATNRRFYEATGLTEAQVIGRYVDEVIPPQSLGVVFSSYRKAIATGQAVSWEEVSRFPSGVKVGEVTVVPIVEEDGRCRQLAGVVHDVTEYRRLLAELELTEERWRLALQGSGAGVWDWHVPDNRVTFSATWRAILGYETHEVDNAFEEWEKRIHPEDKAGLIAGLETLKAKQQATYQNEHRLRHKNGSWVWVHSHAMVIYDSAGKLERMIGTVTDITLRKQAQEIIWQQANFDSLTGLANRGHFSARLRDAIVAAKRENSSFALLLVDLDRFKEVNDSLGHSTGDLLLEEAAIRLRTALPGNAIAARLGGDEFAAVIFGSEQAVQGAAARVVGALEAPYRFALRQAHVTASTGISWYPRHGQHEEELIKQADQAMYYAKAQGGNRIACFTPEMQARSDSRQQMIVDLHLALEREQFHMQYQPIVDLASGETVKAEALIRWRHPLNGTVSPAVFIPLAEEVGLIHPIAKWALYQALSEFKPLSRLGCCQLSINTSSIQFNADSDFAETVLTACEELEVDPACLVLELTESVLLELDEAKEAKFRRLREAGIALALDDFGTGYSSLSYITRLQFDFLKIDRVFTHSIEHNPTSLALCETMISMAHKLGMQVIAEGIENDRQRELLRSAGCGLGQGFLFSPALDLAQFKRCHCEPGC